MDLDAELQRGANENETSLPTGVSAADAQLSVVAEVARSFGRIEPSWGDAITAVED